MVFKKLDHMTETDLKYGGCIIPRGVNYQSIISMPSKTVFSLPLRSMFQFHSNTIFNALLFRLCHLPLAPGATKCRQTIF